ncbi:hypothetical protein Esi_0051_0101 [Ectocarpus siliculosus]|uniref:Cyclic nucleotide-binding domain-containing protein n=1 Tax=Ectocarpus siliculosus TaxID=2880 RepID=D7G3J9_ECTSI|nr:hypothetical protein Esi_0051_0101 [Ectocarpus siliculosus]|eukprot:CBJ26997.1 hypothetical protein Esi_0051_0101 [Ectocarpus siliculosus]
MSVTFAHEGDDASWACTDPSFSYFLVSGSLAPMEIIPNRLSATLLTPTPLHYVGTSDSLKHTLSVELTASEAQLRQDRGEHSARLEAQESKPEKGTAGGVHHPAVYGVQIPGTARSSGDKSRSTAGSTWSPVAPRKDGGLTSEHGGGCGSDIESTLDGGIFSVHRATTPSEVNASDVDFSSNEGEETLPLLPGQSLDCYLLLHRVKIVDPESDPDKPVSLEVVPAAVERATGTTRWKLEARQGSCIGRVFGKGFSAAALEQVALLMERREEPAAAVVRRKGSAVDKVLLVESGEAVRLGDPRENTIRNYSSLRIRAGQLFGAEEALSGLPSYTCNLTATCPLQFFAIPAEAFLRAIDGVWTEPLYRLRSRARVVGHGCRADSAGQERPLTAAGIGGERSLPRNWSSNDALPNLTKSRTRPPPVMLTPVPLFSGIQGGSGLEERENA